MFSYAIYYQRRINKKLNKKYKKSDNNFLWNKCCFNKLYSDRHLKKKITLKLIKKCYLSLSLDILVKHDLSFFSLPIAACIVVYEYLTQKYTSLQLVKDAAKLLISEEKYLQYSKATDNTILVDAKNKNMGFSFTNKKNETNCALLLCKSVSIDYCPEKDTKSKIFNLTWLFSVIDIDNKKIEKCLGTAYDNIDVSDLLPNVTHGNKSLEWHLEFNSRMNAKTIPVKNDEHVYMNGIIENDSTPTDSDGNTIQEHIYNDIEEHVYIHMNRNINDDEYALPSANVQVPE